MKKVSIVILIILLSSTANAQHAYTQRLDKVATITFPDTPKVKKASLSKFYSTTVNGIYYLVQSVDVHKSLRDLFTPHLDDTVYSSFINATIRTTGGRLLYKHNINAHGLQGVEFAYTAISDSVKHFRYRQVFYFNNLLIINGLSSTDSLKAHDRLLNDFFNTFKLTITGDEVKQNDSIDLGRSFLYAIGIIIAIIVLILIIYTIVRITKKMI